LRCLSGQYPECSQRCEHQPRGRPNWQRLQNTPLPEKIPINAFKLGGFAQLASFPAG
jgi:hypothetical protein